MLDREKSWWEGDAAAITLLACVIFLLWFRAPWAMTSHWENDDGCYLRSAAHWAGFRLWGVCVLTERFAPGTGMMWSPAALLSKGLTYLTDQSPLLSLIPLAALLSYGYWALGLLVITWILRDLTAGPGESLLLARTPALLVALLAFSVSLNTPIFYYATHWVLMAHTSEFFVCWLALWAIRTRRDLLSIAACMMVTLIRYNDVPIFLMLGGAWLDRYRAQGFIGRDQKWILMLAGVVTSAAVLGVGWIGFIRGYGDATVWDLLFKYLTWNGVREFFIGYNWGVLWTFPLLIAALVLGIIRWRKTSWMVRGATVFLGIEALLCMTWGTSGADIFYRYLTGSSVASFAIWAEWLEENGSLARNRSKALMRVALIGAAWVFLLTTFYRTIPELSPMVKDGLANMHYFFPAEVLRHLLDPTTYGVIAAQQFPLFSVYVSVMHPDNPALALYAKKGLPLLILTGACAFALSYVFLWSSRNQVFKALLALFHVKKHGKKQELEA